MYGYIKYHYTTHDCLIEFLLIQCDIFLMCRLRTRNSELSFAVVFVIYSMDKYYVGETSHELHYFNSFEYSLNLSRVMADKEGTCVLSFLLNKIFCFLYF